MLAMTKAPLFSARHYRAIAKVLRELTKPGDKETYSIYQTFADFFSEDNPKFQEQKFHNAVYKTED
jgi:hypothetical protein